MHRRTALAGLLALAGCGFAPVYQTSDLAGRFQYRSDDTVLGFHMTTQLAQRLGDPQTPRYTINVTIDERERAAAINASGDTVRLNVIGQADWRVVDLATGLQVGGGTVDAFTSYAATGSTVATQATRDDARARLATLLADMIVTRILARASDFQR